MENLMLKYKFRVQNDNKNGVLWSQARMSFEMRLRWDLVIGAGNQSINEIKKLPNYSWKKQMITVSDLQMGHWQLVIKNKSFESVEECWRVK